MLADVCGHPFELPLRFLKTAGQPLITCELEKAAGLRAVWCANRLHSLYTPRRTPAKGIPTGVAVCSKADVAFELWQTECSRGMIFALRVSFVRSEQARRNDQAGDSNASR
jgi:hypothetical protein